MDEFLLPIVPSLYFFINRQLVSFFNLSFYYHISQFKVQIEVFFTDLHIVKTQHCRKYNPLLAQGSHPSRCELELCTAWFKVLSNSCICHRYDITSNTLSL